jgi:hypothetical protein
MSGIQPYFQQPEREFAGVLAAGFAYLQATLAMAASCCSCPAVLSCPVLFFLKIIGLKFSEWKRPVTQTGSLSLFLTDQLLTCCNYRILR